MSGYAHQDWKPIVFGSSKKTKSKETVTVAKQSGAKQNKNATLRKMDDPDYVPQKIPRDLQIQIIQARQAKKMTQKQLAIQCNLHESIIKSYENGDVVANQQILNKIGKALGKRFSIKKQK